MDAGEVVQIGDHDTLIGQGGLYSRLVTHQLSANTT